VFVLITGCAGFIGSHICEKLLETGHTVLGVDALTKYYDADLKIKNLNRCLDFDSFHFRRGLITDLERGLVEEAELIFHLAAQPGVRGSWGNDFDTYLDLNVLETQRLLECARLSGNLKKLVYASSSSVYGNTEAAQVAEDHFKAPYSPYGVTKLAAEQLCSLYHANFGLPSVSLRLFTVFGPRQRPDMLFSRLIAAAFAGTRFPLFGDGEMHRDMTSVHDVVDAFLLAAGAPVASGVFNVAGGLAVSINEAIATVEELMGVRIRVERHPEQYGDVRRTGADISKARKQLGYSPRRGLRETLQEQIEFTENLLRATRRAPAACA
jgi:nucleoside-diphosphate-sugar epimerase